MARVLMLLWRHGVVQSDAACPGHRQDRHGLIGTCRSGGHIGPPAACNAGMEEWLHPELLVAAVEC